MKKMSNLPKDLLEEILSRVPVQSMRTVRFTCKTWNTLSKDDSFTKNHLAQTKAARREGEFQVVMMMDYKVYIMSFNLHGIHNNVDPSINGQAQLISLDDSDQVDISKVYHCNGLLLCLTKYFTRLIVWNPYTGQTQWIEPRCHRGLGRHVYVIGYEARESFHNYKILRCVGYIIEYEMYDLDSNSWRSLDVLFKSRTYFHKTGISVKGNTYWYIPQEGEMGEFLFCFDFATERFGQKLALPFQSKRGHKVTQSSVREGLLAVLLQRFEKLRIEIWITNKIDPNAVSWNKLFVAVDMKLPPRHPVIHGDVRFYIDEGKKVAVVFL